MYEVGIQILNNSKKIFESDLKLMCVESGCCAIFCLYPLIYNIGKIFPMVLIVAVSVPVVAAG